jgi:hypothetical protein
MKKFAYFLPQFYPTPENDKYWGKGFTEWTNVKSASKLFKKHRQPIKPAKFGYYNLLESEKFTELCDYSIEKGINGFGYWHYWFGNGYQTLEKVPELHLHNKHIKQNYFFSWANLNWTKSWVGNDLIIFRQQYSDKDAKLHFEYLSHFVEDDRYIKINGNPLIQVLKPSDPGCEKHLMIVDDMMFKRFGVNVKWMFPSNDILKTNHLDYLISGYPPGEVLKQSLGYKLKSKINSKILKRPTIVDVDKYILLFEKNLKKWSEAKSERYVPCLLSGWDNTPRYGNRGFVIDAEINNLLSRQIDILSKNYKKPNVKDPKFILIKAFNEWAEGNIIEPYTESGKYIEPVTGSLDQLLE